MPSFEVTLQFWASLVEKGLLPRLRNLSIERHTRALSGERMQPFLKQRHALMSQHHLFREMEIQ